MQKGEAQQSGMQVAQRLAVHGVERFLMGSELDGKVRDE